MIPEVLPAGLPWWMPLALLVWLVQMLAFHGVGLLFEWFDRTGKLSAYRVRPADRLSYRRLLPRVLFNQVFILLPAMLAVQWAGLAFVGEAHLAPWMFIAGLVLMGLGHDVVQYVFHRFVLHRPRFMVLLGHRVHHSTRASRAISACYMSGPDFFLEITLPYLVPLMLIGGGGADITFHLLVVSVGAVGGLYEHSGYDFAQVFRPQSAEGLRGRVLSALSGLASSHAHAEHHRRSNVSFSDGFGSPGVCDTVLGTRWDQVPADHAGATPAADRPSEAMR